VPRKTKSAEEYYADVRDLGRLCSLYTDNSLSHYECEKLMRRFSASVLRTALLDSLFPTRMNASGAAETAPEQHENEGLA